MRKIVSLLLPFVLSVSIVFSQSDGQWPRLINSGGYSIKIYQPQVENFSGDTVRSRGAFSISGNGKTDPVFGALWTKSTLQTNREKRTAILDNIRVLDIKFTGDSNASDVARLKSILEKEIPKW